MLLYVVSALYFEFLVSEFPGLEEMSYYYFY